MHVVDVPLKIGFVSNRVLPEAPLPQRVFAIATALHGHPDVQTTRLIGGKVTYLHRDFWPALLAVADSDNVIHVWDDPAAGHVAQVLHGHSDEIRFLTFNPDGTRLASAGNDQAVHIWDPRAGRLLAGQNAQSKYALSAAGGKLASSCGGCAPAGRQNRTPRRGQRSRLS